MSIPEGSTLFVRGGQWVTTPHGEIAPQANDGITHTVGSFQPLRSETYTIEIDMLVRDTVTGKGAATRFRAVIQGDPAAPVQIALSSEFLVNNIGINSPTLSAALVGTNLNATINNPVAGNPVNVQCRFASISYG